MTYGVLLDLSPALLAGDANYCRGAPLFASGMNRSYLSHLESGRRNPTLATLERLAKTLKVTPGTFFEDVSARRPRTKH